MGGRWFIAGIVAGWLAGCGAPGPTEGTASTAGLEIDWLDVAALARDAGAQHWDADELPRGLIGSGLGPAQHPEEGPSFRWVTSEIVSLNLQVDTPDTPLQLTVVFARNRHPEAPEEQLVTATTRQSRFETRVIEGRTSALSWEIPAESFALGANRLQLEFAGLRHLSGTGGKPDRIQGPRLLSVEVQPLQKLGGRADVLRIFKGTDVRVPLAGASSVELVVDGLEWTGEAPPEVEVALHVDAGRATGPLYRPVTRWRPGEVPEGEVSVSLPLATDETAYLVLSAAGTGGGAVKVLGPRISRAVPAAAEVSPVASRLPDQRAPNVIVYLADTMRSDRVGLLGGPRPTTPYLASLVEGGAAAWTAQSNCSWTRPSVATIHSGLEQGATGVLTKDDGLPGDVPVLAERFSAAGYHTVALFSNPHVQVSTGFGRGFDQIIEAQRPERTDDRKKPSKIRSDQIVGDVVEQIAQAPADKPLFFFVHSLASHAPYHPPDDAQEALGGMALPLLDGERLDEAQGQVDWIVGVGGGRRPLDPAMIEPLTFLYDAEILNEDRQVEKVVGALREAGRWDDTLFVFVSDHGEQLGDHGALSHGRWVYRELLEVPLVMRWPKGWTVSASDEASLLDVAPTVLHAAGLPALPDAQGISLISGEAPPEWTFARAGASDFWSASNGEYKLIWRRGPDAGVELYDLLADPTEQRNVAGENPARVDLLQRLVLARQRENTRIRRHYGRRRAEPSVSDVEALRALGYVH